MHYSRRGGSNSSVRRVSGRAASSSSSSRFVARSSGAALAGAIGTAVSLGIRRLPVTRDIPSLIGKGGFNIETMDAGYSLRFRSRARIAGGVWRFQNYEIGDLTNPQFLLSLLVVRCRVLASAFLSILLSSRHQLDGKTVITYSFPQRIPTEGRLLLWHNGGSASHTLTLRSRHESTSASVRGIRGGWTVPMSV